MVCFFLNKLFYFIIHWSQAPQCVKVLTYSGWNPPPGNRRMHGDLLYIYVVTLEDKKYHLTASTHGFFVNQSVYCHND